MVRENKIGKKQTGPKWRTDNNQFLVCCESFVYEALCNVYCYLNNGYKTNIVDLKVYNKTIKLMWERNI